MTPQAMRLAIAEFEGWKLCDQEYKEHCRVAHSGKKWIPPSGSYRFPWHRTKEEAFEFACSQMDPRLPDYTTDLNAIARVEAKLTDEQHHQFRMYLWMVTYPANNSRLAYRGCEHDRFYVGATALQRCEALLRAIGRRSDGEEP